MFLTCSFLSIFRCNSCPEQHFWCKYRYKSENLQTISDFFSKKAQKVEQKPAFCRHFNVFNPFF